MLEKLDQAKILITNFHAFMLREKVAGRQADQGDSRRGRKSVFYRDAGPDGAPRLPGAGQQEKYRCHQRRGPSLLPPQTRRRREQAQRATSGRKQKSAKKRRAYGFPESRLSRAKIGVKTIYDLSATPFFLRGSGYSEGTLFPWVVSDFSLIDAIESGIVKVPRVPVADDSMLGEQPTYRDLWLRIREDLPRKGRKTEAVSGEPKLPAELQGALHSLYSNYEKYYRLWERKRRGAGK